MEKKFDPTKPVQLRDGRPARVYATDAEGDYPIHGAYQGYDGTWIVGAWCTNGLCALEQIMDRNERFDLVNVPEKIVQYLNVYPSNDGYAYPTREQADRAATKGRIACPRVEFGTGQFDD